MDSTGVILTRVLRQSGCEGALNGSRMALELALHPEIKKDRKAAAERERARLIGKIEAKRLLFTGNTKEDAAVRNALGGLISELKGG